MDSAADQHEVVEDRRALRRHEHFCTPEKHTPAVMDMVISGGEGSLLESLSFDLPPTTSYIHQRRLVSYYLSGASTLSPNGVRVCRFTIAEDGWLDPASLRSYGKLYNGSQNNTVLQLADGPHSLFSRVRLFIGGALVEDIDLHNRSQQLFRRMLMPNDWVVNDSIESGLQSAIEGAAGSSSPGIASQQLAAGKYAMWNMATLLGILNCGNMLPLRVSGGCQVELTLADAADAIVSGTSLSTKSKRCPFGVPFPNSTAALERAFHSS